MNKGGILMQWRDRFGGVSKTYICPHCGKLFMVPYQSKGGGKTQWVYRRKQDKRQTYYCSYHCLRESENQIYDGTYT